MEYKHDEDWMLKMQKMVRNHLHEICKGDKKLSMFISSVLCTVLEERGKNLNVVLDGLTEQTEVTIDEVEEEMCAKAVVLLDKYYD